MMSVRQFVRARSQAGDRVLILRHDVDVVSPATRIMSRLERSYGATASYYFRNSTYDPQLMRTLEATGNEASLHFETISDYARANSIEDKQELVRRNFLEPCRTALVCNLQLFRTLVGVPCATIAAHGDSINRRIGVPNSYLTSSRDSYTYFGIELEVYDEQFLRSIDHYVSDDAPDMHGGYRGETTPTQAIRSESAVVLFLTHPHHWYFDPWQRLRKALELCLPVRTSARAIVGVGPQSLKR